MGLFSVAKLFGMTIRESANDGSDFTNPDADYRRLFLGEDGQLHVKDSAGTVTSIGAAGSVATDTIWDAAGDLVQGTGADTAAKLSAGTAGKVLTSNGAAAALTWETPSGGSLAVTSAILTATDGVALTQNSYTDIISVSLAAGTYIIWATTCVVSASGAQDASARIYNSTDAAVLASGNASLGATSYNQPIPLLATVVLGGTKTIKLQGTHSGASGATAQRSTQTNGAGNNVTQLVALKVA